MNHWQTKILDVGAVAPLMVWYGLGIGRAAPQIAAQAAALQAGFTLAAALDLASRTTTLAFLALQIVLFLIRRLPETKAPGAAPRLAALIGANIQLAFLALPRAAPGLVLTSLGTALTAAGMAGAILVVSWLGRSFSIFPQARRIVVAGPYRLVRHPLYLAEQVSTLGVALQYAQPWSLLVGVASFAAQFPRMHYEEKILAATYPDYEAYAAGTWRLFPGFY